MLLLPPHQSALTFGAVTRLTAEVALAGAQVNQTIMCLHAPHVAHWQR